MFVFMISPSYPDQLIPLINLFIYTDIFLYDYHHYCHYYYFV